MQILQMFHKRQTSGRIPDGCLSLVLPFFLRLLQKQLLQEFRNGLKEVPHWHMYFLLWLGAQWKPIVLEPNVQISNRKCTATYCRIQTLQTHYFHIFYLSFFSAQAWLWSTTVGCWEEVNYRSVLKRKCININKPKICGLFRGFLGPDDS